MSQSSLFLSSPQGAPSRGVRCLSQLVLLVAVALVLSGCGYALVGKASNIPEDIRKVYVEPMENRTSRSQVEQILTQSIVDEMVTRRRFEVINEEGDADAVLKGTVVDFQVRPVAFDSGGLATDYEIQITTDMLFQRPPRDGEVEGEVIWKNARYLFREDYPLEEGDAGYFDRENLAIEETASGFAETLVTDLLEGF